MNTPVPALPYPDEEYSLRGHLFIHHSLHTTATTGEASLQECHEEEHAGPLEPVHPHTHKAAVETTEEWSWE